MNANMKEISSRIMVNDGEGMACGPCGILAADAETVVLDAGKAVYLHAQWISEAPGVLHEATAESVYDVYGKLNRSEGDFEALIGERDRICGEGISRLFSGCDAEERYAVQFEKLDALIRDELEARGYSMEDGQEEEDD